MRRVCQILTNLPSLQTSKVGRIKSQTQVSQVQQPTDFKNSQPKKNTPVPLVQAAQILYQDRFKDWRKGKYFKLK